MRIMINSVIGLLTLLYPFAVYFGIRYLEPWKMASILVVLLSIRLIASCAAKHWSSPLLMVGMVYFSFAIWSNKLLTLRFYPAIANAAMLLLFSWSLLSPFSLIERIVRIQHPNLQPEGHLYASGHANLVRIFYCQWQYCLGNCTLEK